jgi:hypothetical protein
MRTGLGGGTRRYLVATASHCHGLARSVEVGSPSVG